MDSPVRARRSDTRERIQDIALDLFAEQGYEKTSLREIADRLGVTKAALYYHFKTKEDILVSLFDDLSEPLDQLIEWAAAQPRTVETRREVIQRYEEVMIQAKRLFRFLYENQASIRDLNLAEAGRERLFRLMDTLVDEDAPLTHRLRCHLAVMSLSGAKHILNRSPASEEDKRAAAREVALDLIDF